MIKYIKEVCSRFFGNTYAVKDDPFPESVDEDVLIDLLNNMEKESEKRLIDEKEIQMKELGIDYHEDLGQRTRGDGGVYRKVYVDLYKKDGKDFYVEIDAVCVDIAPDPALFRLENLKHHINGFRTIDIKWSCDRCLKKNTQTYDRCNYCGHPRKWRNC